MISEDLHHPMEMFPWAVACPEGKAHPGRFRGCLHVMYSQDIKARGAGPWTPGGSGCTQDEPEEPRFPPERRQWQQEVLILPSTAGGTRSWRSSVAPCGCSQPGKQRRNVCSPLQQRLRQAPDDRARLGRAPTLDATVTSQSSHTRATCSGLKPWKKFPTGPFPFQQQPFFSGQHEHSRDQKKT